MEKAKLKVWSEIVEFVLSEAQRQNSAILETADALQTKVGLYLVFAVFVFSTQIELIKGGSMGGIAVSVRLAIVSSALVLMAMLLLLRAALVRSHSMPPLVYRFRE